MNDLRWTLGAVVGGSETMPMERGDTLQGC